MLLPHTYYRISPASTEMIFSNRIFLTPRNIRQHANSSFPWFQGDGTIHIHVVHPLFQKLLPLPGKLCSIASFLGLIFTCDVHHAHYIQQEVKSIATRHFLLYLFYTSQADRHKTHLSYIAHHGKKRARSTYVWKISAGCC